MKVFLLEDEDAIGMGLKYSLEKEGYEVTHVKTALEAKKSWQKNAYDICILDINLPDGNGYDICKFIKESEDIPVIFLTADESEGAEKEGLSLGAMDFIRKLMFRASVRMV